MNKDFFKNKFRIPSNRLKNWDYSDSGYYYVTICVNKRLCCLAEIINRKKYLLEQGKVVEKCWFDLPNHYPNIELDEFTIMPNHLHGILIIHKKCRDVINHVSTNKFELITPMGKNNLGEIIRSFKGKTSFKIHQLFPNFSWQPNYYDRIIRTEREYFEIRNYIRFNHLNWETDEENPEKE